MTQSVKTKNPKDPSDFCTGLSKLGRKILGIGDLMQKAAVDETSKHGMNVALYGLGESLQDYSEEIEAFAVQVEQHWLKNASKERKFKK